MTPSAFDQKEASQYLGLCVKTVRKLLMDGEIWHRKIGRRFIIPKAALDEFMERDNGNARLLAKEMLR